MDNKKIRLASPNTVNESNNTSINSNQSSVPPITTSNSNELIFPFLNNPLPIPPHTHPIGLFPPIFPHLNPFSFSPIPFSSPFGLQWPPPPPPPFIPPSTTSIPPMARILPPPPLPAFNRMTTTTTTTIIENNPNNVIRPQTPCSNSSTTNVIKNQNCIHNNNRHHHIVSKSYSHRDDEKRNNNRSSSFDRYKNDDTRTRSNRFNNGGGDDDDDEKYMNKNKIQEIMDQIYSKKIIYKRSTPLEPYYKQKPLIVDKDEIIQTIEGTQQLIDLRDKFKNEILSRAERFRSLKPAFSFPKRKIKLKAHKHHHGKLFIIQKFCSNLNFSPTHN